MPLPILWARLFGFGRGPGFGRSAEIRGSEYLRSQGYRLAASPYRVSGGEVDIVAWDGDCLVFVEVKARRRDEHPEDAVNYPKRRRLVRAARAYRTRHRLGDRPYRFDILAVIEPEGRDPEFRLIRDAFREHPGGGDSVPTNSS